MFWFSVQAALLMLAAYFAGCFVGCMVRRTVFAHTLQPVTGRLVPAAVPAPAPAPAPGSPAPQVAQQTRFERALTGAGTPSATPAATPAAQPVAPIPTPAVARAGEPVAPPAPAAVVPAQVAPIAPAATAAAVTAAMTAVAAAARAQQQTPGILPTAMGTSGPASVTAPVAAPAPVPAPVPVASTPDLTRIRAIDEAMQKSLHALGVKSYGDIAAWRPEDVVRVAGALKIPGRIEQENWIEQAQILAKGGETYYSRRKSTGELPSARPTPDEGERITVRVPAGTRPAEAQPPVNTAASVAPAVAASAAAAVVAAVAAKAAAPTPVPVQAATTSESPIGMARDSLQRIAGINSEVERLLHVQGVARYSQIAEWSASDISRFDRLLGFEGRIARENWIEQAQILAKGGETAFARDLARRAAEAARPARLADAIQARAEAAPAVDSTPAVRAGSNDLSALRSVRSEAYRTAEAAAVPGGPGRPGDDLKRIRGVGVLIEKKLNALGVTRYDQVANWTAADIERFSEKLDFKGRIERENWVEQARILSAGGQTEFSQRVDRGEVESSRGPG